MEAIFLLSAPLLTMFSGRVWLLEDYIEQWIMRLTGTPLEFSGNPFPTSDL